MPYVTGRDVSQFTMPDGACDCHFHIFDPLNFPYKESDVRNQAPATVDCYRLFMRHTGVDRCVIVTPSCYGFDNSCTISALRRLGSCARAVVVVDSSVSDEQLQEMNRYGVRGIRFNVVSGNDETIRNAVSLSERVAKLGWHTDFYMSPDLIIKMKNVLEDYPTQIVLDHMGSMPKDPGVKHEAYDFILSLIRAGKGYVKTSGFYLHSKEADYSDTIEVARNFIQDAPEGCLWGSDWPHHACYFRHKPTPDDAKLIDAVLLDFDEDRCHKILVENPAKIYGF